MEFADLIRQVYNNATKKYEEIVQGVVTDADLNELDFPMVTKPFAIESFKSLLSPELADKLHLEADEEEPQIEERPEVTSNFKIVQSEPKVGDEFSDPDEEEMKASEIQAKMSAASTGETTNMTSSNKGGEEFDEE